MFGIGVMNLKFPQNIGTLFRSAHLMGASYCFTVGARYKRQRTDTMNATKQIAYHAYANLEELRKEHYKHRLVGVEMGESAVSLSDFVHPDACIYLLGSEDRGLSKDEMDQCDDLVRIPCGSLNVAVAGSIVLYDRLAKELYEVESLT